MKHPIATFLLGIFCALFGVACLGLASYESIKKISASNWLSVQATIETSEVYESPSRHRMFWCPNWKYSYVVSGTAYQSNMMEPTLTTGRHCFPTKKAAEENVQNLPPGSFVTAYYSPSDPSQSALIIQSVGIFEFFLVASGCVFIWAGGSLLLIVRRHFLKQKGLSLQ